MTMELEPKSGGRMAFSLGPVEKWFITGLLAGTVYMAGWMVVSIQSLLTHQAVTNQRLSVIVEQQGDIRRIGVDVAEMKVRVSNIEDRTRELEQTRRAK